VVKPSKGLASQSVLASRDQQAQQAQQAQQGRTELTARTALLKKPRMMDRFMEEVTADGPQ
jgi:hypothetical protein